MAYYKKSLPFLLSILLSLTVTAQVPVPEICAVSVDTNTGYPQIYWSVEDTSLLDGYIVKRVILDGSGVVSGTLNNIWVIDNNKDTVFLDTVYVYQTTAKPWLRSEQYVVTAFKNNGSSAIYSGFSNKVKTIYLEAEKSQCNDQITLKWNKTQVDNGQYSIFYKKDNKFELLTSTTDTFYTYTPTEKGTYLFRIKTQSTLCSQTAIFSNTDTVETERNVIPQELYIESISATQDGMELMLHVIPQENTPVVKLYRDGQAIATFNTLFEGIFHDTASTTGIHTYQLISYDLCDDQYYKSGIAKSILLKGSASTNTPRKNYLEWNPYNYWDGQTAYYEIYFSADSTQLEYLAQSEDSIYTHDLTYNIFRGDTKSKFYYRVCAYEENNPNGYKGISKSNIVELEQPPLVFVPNAINPASSIEEERYVKVFCNFCDSFDFTVKDSNGRIVFKSSDPMVYWYGTYPDGSRAPQGAYVYLLKVRNNGKTYRFRGYINLIEQ